MNTVIKLVLGIVLGVVVSIISLAIAQIAANVLIGGALGNTITVVVLLTGALLGAVSVGLGYLTAGVERSVVVLLIALAVAAVVVIAGQYGNGSILPLGIYGLTAANGLVIARVTAVLGEPANETRGPRLPR